MVEGKIGDTTLNDILIDTGAEISVVAKDIVPQETKIIGKTTIKGATGSEVVCNRVSIPVQVAGKQFDLEAAVLPRSKLGNSALIGQNCPGLRVQWTIGPQTKEKPQKENNPDDKEHVNVLTRSQVQKEKEELKQLEEADRNAELIPTPIMDLDKEDEHEDRTPTPKRSRRRNKFRQPELEELPQEYPQEEQPVPTIEISTEAAITREQFIQLQKDDPALEIVRKNTGKSDSPFSENNGMLMMDVTDEFGEPKSLLVVPKPLRQDVFKAAHSALIAGHLGMHNTKAKIATNFYWPGLTKDVERWCRQCTECQRVNDVKGNIAPLNPLPIVPTPWEKIALDIVGPITRTKRGHKYLLTCICMSTRFPEAIPLKSIETKAIIDPLFSILSRHGVPKVILTDHLFQDCLNKLGISKIESTPYRPQSNGCIERFHSTLKRCLKKQPKCSEDWDLLIPYVLFALRESPCRATGYAPFELMYGREVRGPSKILRDTWVEQTPEHSTHSEILNQIRSRLTIVRDIAFENERTLKNYNKEHYNKKANAPPLEIGQEVLVKIPTEPKGIHSEWKGPFTILNRPSNVTYTLDAPYRGERLKTFHRNSLKPHIRNVDNVKVIMAEGSLEGQDLPIVLNPTAEPTGPDKVDLSHLSAPQQQPVNQLFQSYPSVFSKIPGNAKVDPISIKTDSDYPIAQHPYGIPPAKLSNVKKEIEELLSLGIIEPSKSMWASPVVLVDKPDGSIRICINYKALNSHTTQDNYPLPHIDRILQEASHSKYISTLDLNKGFHQIPVAPDSTEKTAFILPFGKYCYKRMPFGLKNAPAHFQRIMNTLLAAHTHAQSYIDDIVVYSQSFEDHITHLTQLFDILKEHRLTAKLQKCKFFQQTLNFLGHHIGKGQIQPQQAKVYSMKNFILPKTKRKLRSFLGTVNYYRKFIPHFSQIAAPFYTHTSKKYPEKIQWNPQLTEAFENLKQALTDDAFLIAPDYKKTFYLATDASYAGIGAVLSQKDKVGQERPVAYFSQRLSKAEKNYSVTEIELLAVVKSIQHFQIYLLGTHFVLQTDHKALTYLDRFQNANKRLVRWAMSLQNYSFTVEYKPGSNNSNADALSRQDWPIEEDTHLPGGRYSKS